MVAFAAKTDHRSSLPADAVVIDHATVGSSGPAYGLTICLPADGEPVKSQLVVTSSAWSPELYVPTVQTLLARRKVVSPAPDDAGPDLSTDADLLRALTTPLTADMEAQNQRLTRVLQTHPLDARAHDQAALLLGTLALRENSGLFWDPRALCNRAVAHLALARALHPEASECGEVAELLVGLILDTKADCQRRIAALQARVGAHPELGPWAMAAALRNTRDYRLLPHPQNATFLERLELFRATGEAISIEQAVTRLGTFEHPNAPDWSRIVMQAGGGVGVGHRFTAPSVAWEMAEVRQIFPEIQSATTPERFAAIYNQPADDAVGVGADGQAHFQVIGRGLWAQWFQRHLLHSVNETDRFLDKQWGVPEEAKAFRGKVQPLLQGLTLYPLCFAGFSKGDGEPLLARAAELVNQHPEQVSDAAWYEVIKQVPAHYAPGGAWLPVSEKWFTPRLPTGTAYGFFWREGHGGILPPLDTAELTKLHAIAPLQYSVCSSYAYAVGGNHLDVEPYRKAMAPLLPYYLPALWAEASLVKNDPAQYGAVMNQAAALEPSYYVELGKYLADHHQEAKAAEAYQAAIDHGADAIQVANNCAWLVNYYYDHGQQAQAITIAQQAAEVYSDRGLETWAALLERLGREAEAVHVYEQIKERYHDDRSLLSFYARHAATNPEYAARWQAAQTAVFPQGMQTVTLAQLTGAPTEGVLVHGANALSRQCGLKAGAIVVALDGKRVQSMEQYTFVRTLSDDPHLELLVFQDHQYQAIHANVPNRRFELVFTTWHQP